MSSWVTTLASTVIGAGAGGAIAHLSAKARGREEHERTIDLLIMQDERRAAQAALVATRRIRNGVAWGLEEVSLGTVHNEWQDEVLAPTRLIRSDELDNRVRVLGTVLYHAMLVKPPPAPYALTRAAQDVEEWIEAWLRNDAPPPAHLPPLEELRSMMIDRSHNQVTFDALTDYLIART